MKEKLIAGKRKVDRGWGFIGKTIRMAGCNKYSETNKMEMESDERKLKFFTDKAKSSEEKNL